MTWVRKNVFILILHLMAIFIGLIIYNVTKWDSTEPEVTTKLGVIRGLRATNGNYSMYLGIPYAVVDRNNPFGESTPFPKFKGVFNAHDDTSMCLQLEEYNGTISGTIDCLQLNIYVPDSAPEKKRLPVLVFIHGGRNEVGFAGRYIYGPTFLMKEDIILVTIAFRLGPYGFMCLDTPDIPGNQGLKDQLHALRWVKKNIDAFGGDPQRITLDASSSSGTHISLHLMRTHEPLFQKAIFQSGLKANPLLLKEPDVTVPLRIAEYLGFKTSNTSEALKFLAAKDPVEVIKSSIELKIQYMPCVEKEFENVENFNSKYISDITDTPVARNMPILVTQTEKESLYTYSLADFDTNNHIFKDILNSIFDFNNEELQRMEERVKSFYIGDKEVSNDVKRNIIDFLSDILHNYPTKTNIDKFIETGVKKLYYGMFTYVGERNFIRQLYQVDDSYEGATHSDEMGYLFDISLIKDKHTAEDQLIIDRTTALWANFVKYGEPTPTTSKLLPLKWEPVTKDTLFYYKIDTEISTGIQPFRDRMAFWDQFYKLNGKYERLVERKPAKK